MKEVSERGGEVLKGRKSILAQYMLYACAVNILKSYIYCGKGNISNKAYVFRSQLLKGLLKASALVAHNGSLRLHGTLKLHKSLTDESRILWLTTL